MQETQVEVKPKNQQQKTTVQAPIVTSRFNDEEYERWSENLRNRNKSNGK